MLSESKYGGSTFGNVMRMSLVRGPNSPDPQCDRGRHDFAYALMPHAGGWREAGVVADVVRFNFPLRRGGYASADSFAAVVDENLVLDTIKPAEDGDGVVYRLYGCHGARGTARLALAMAAGRAVLCDVLEEPGEALPMVDGKIAVKYTPYQIVSVRAD